MSILIGARLCLLDCIDAGDEVVMRPMLLRVCIVKSQRAMTERGPPTASTRTASLSCRDGCKTGGEAENLKPVVHQDQAVCSHQHRRAQHHDKPHVERLTRLEGRGLWCNEGLEYLSIHRAVHWKLGMKVVEVLGLSETVLHQLPNPSYVVHRGGNVHGSVSEMISV